MWTRARWQQELLEKQGPKCSGHQTASQHLSMVAHRPRKPPHRKKKKVTRSTAGRRRTSLSGSIWRRLDTGRPDQLLQQTKITLLPASVRGRVRRQLPGPEATQGWEHALHSLPAPTCGQGGPSPLHSTSRVLLHLNHTSAQLARGSGKPSACHHRVKIQKVIYFKYQRSNTSVLAFGSSWL